MFGGCLRGPCLSAARQCRLRMSRAGYEEEEVGGLPPAERRPLRPLEPGVSRVPSHLQRMKRLAEKDIPPFPYKEEGVREDPPPARHAPVKLAVKRRRKVKKLPQKCEDVDGMPEPAPPPAVIDDVGEDITPVDEEAESRAALSELVQSLVEVDTAFAALIHPIVSNDSHTIGDEALAKVLMEFLSSPHTADPVPHGARALQLDKQLAFSWVHPRELHWDLADPLESDRRPRFFAPRVFGMIAQVVDLLMNLPNVRAGKSSHSVMVRFLMRHGHLNFRRVESMISKDLRNDLDPLTANMHVCYLCETWWGNIKRKKSNLRHVDFYKLIDQDIATMISRRIRFSTYTVRVLVKYFVYREQPDVQQVFRVLSATADKHRMVLHPSTFEYLLRAIYHRKGSGGGIKAALDLFSFLRQRMLKEFGNKRKNTQGDLPRYGKGEVPPTWPEFGEFPISKALLPSELRQNFYQTMLELVVEARQPPEVVEWLMQVVRSEASEETTHIYGTLMTHCRNTNDYDGAKALMKRAQQASVWDIRPAVAFSEVALRTARRRHRTGDIQGVEGILLDLWDAWLVKLGDDGWSKSNLDAVYFFQNAIRVAKLSGKTSAVLEVYDLAKRLPAIEDETMTVIYRTVIDSCAATGNWRAAECIMWNDVFKNKHKTRAVSRQFRILRTLLEAHINGPAPRPDEPRTERVLELFFFSIMRGELIAPAVLEQVFELMYRKSLIHGNAAVFVTASHNSPPIGLEASDLQCLKEQDIPLCIEGSPATLGPHDELPKGTIAVNSKTGALVKVLSRAVKGTNSNSVDRKLRGKQRVEYINGNTTFVYPNNLVPVDGVTKAIELLQGTAKKGIEELQRDSTRNDANNSLALSTEKALATIETFKTATTNDMRLKVIDDLKQRGIGMRDIFNVVVPEEVAALVKGSSRSVLDFHSFARTEVPWQTIATGETQELALMIHNANRRQVSDLATLLIEGLRLVGRKPEKPILPLDQKPPSEEELQRIPEKPGVVGAGSREEGEVKQDEEDDNEKGDPVGFSGEGDAVEDAGGDEDGGGVLEAAHAKIDKVAKGGAAKELKEPITTRFVFTAVGTLLNTGKHEAIQELFPPLIERLEKEHALFVDAVLEALAAGKRAAEVGEVLNKMGESVLEPKAGDCPTSLDAVADAIRLLSRQ